jgi:hypothetical protein
MRCSRTQAATAPLQNLSSKLVKARHCLHAVNLQVESIRSECDKARRQVEANDAEIAGMEQEEERLKLQYVESALVSHRVGSPACRAERAWRPDLAELATRSNELALRRPRSIPRPNPARRQAQL